MQKSKHSKYRNTGIIFELLTRQIASDILSNVDSQAIPLIKKYFSNTELAKEHKLYQSLVTINSISEIKANNLIEAILKLSERLNKTALKKEKYNLIKEIKENYNIDDFFKAKIQNYKINASIFNLIEFHTSPNFINPSHIVENRNTLLNFLTDVNIYKEPIKNDVLEEYNKQDKGTRMLIYKMVVENFNTKYDILIPEQKKLLKEYINNVSNTTSLKDYINTQTENIKLELEILSKKINDPITKIKLNEVNNILNPIPKSETVNDDDVLNLMNYYELLNELRNNVK
jgi:hypothetical protein